MKCFAHDTADAVAICKACGRGTCRTCATLVGNWVACGASCATAVASLNDMVQRTGPRMRATHKAQAAVFLVLFFAAALAGVIADGVGRGVMLSAAALLRLACVRYFRLAAMYKDGQRKGQSLADTTSQEN